MTDYGDEATVRDRGTGDGPLGLPEEVAAAQYQLFVERVHDYALFLMDADGVVTHWGEGAARMKRFTAGEVVGRHLRRMYPEGGAEDGTAEDHLRHAARFGEYIGEGTRLRGDGTTFVARVVLTALRRDGRLYGFGKVTQDLTERREAEARLHGALRAAEAANVEKSRFLATMSHEIRTPINAILGYADLLDLGVAGTLSHAQRGYLDRVRASGRHLLSLIEDVLDFARVEAAREPVQARTGRAATAAETALVLLRPQAEARGLTLELSCDPSLEYWGDEVRVRQIVTNLVGNAAKFTEPGGRVRVWCGRGEPDGSADLQGAGPWTCIHVEDTGIGIPADRLAAVFEPFVQLDNSLTRAHQGTGLGLAISRRFARLMGGDLTVRSREGHGSTFILWLPADEVAAGGASAGGGRPMRGSLTRIGHHLGSVAHQVVRTFTDRLRVDPATPSARERTRAELEDHVATLLTDLGQVLVVLEEDGSDAPATAADARDVQSLLAERHGEQRARLGWTEAGLVREYHILREEVEAALRDPARADSAEEGLETVLGLLDRLAHASLLAFRAAREKRG
jgi:PAS domain S-box-containing protein